MDIQTFKRQYDEAVTAIEQFQSEMQTVVLNLLSPAHDQETLPSFVKRIRYRLHAPGGGAEQQKQTEGKGYRVVQWRKAVDLLRRKLDSVRARVENISVVSSPTDSNTPVPFPSLDELRQQQQVYETRSRIVSTRLASALTLFQSILTNSRSSWQQELTLHEATVDVQQVLAETLLTRFYTEVDNIAVVLRQFYEKQIATHLRRFEEHCEKQRRKALDQQQTFYRDVFGKVRQQHETFDKMMQLLSDQLHQSVGHHQTRIRLDARIRRLFKRNQSLFIEAEIFYQTSHDSFVFQPLSPVFYRALRQWLVEFQQLFADIILGAQSTITSGGDASTSSASTAAATPVLHQFIKKAVFASSTAGVGGLDEVPSALLQPSADTVSSLFTAFLAFHQQVSRSNLERLQRQIQQLEGSWTTLTEQVARAHQLQQKWYTFRDQKQAMPTPVDILEQSKSAAAMTSPDVIRLLLQLDTQLKELQGRLESTYATLFTQLKPELAATLAQNQHVIQITEHLGRWQQLNREWEALIRQEKTFLKAWKDASRTNSRHIAMQFIEWNYAATDELDRLQTTVELYAANIFNRYREYFGRFVSTLLDIQQKRHEAAQLETKMLNSLFDDIRKEDIGASDVLARLQTQTQEWVDHMRRLQLSAQQTRFKQTLQYHVAGLDALLTRYSLDEFQQHPIERLLATMDSMYEATIRCEENSAAQQTLVAKEQFLLDKLQLAPEVAGD